MWINSIGFLNCKMDNKIKPLGYSKFLCIINLVLLSTKKCFTSTERLKRVPPFIMKQENCKNVW